MCQVNGILYYYLEILSLILYKEKGRQKQKALVTGVSHLSLISSEVGSKTVTASLYLVLT